MIDIECIFGLDIGFRSKTGFYLPPPPLCSKAGSSSLQNVCGLGAFSDGSAAEKLKKFLKKLS
ncbi:MAG: hypothetical protein LBJ03_03750, partial [Holosporales bacterium]|nr:hypothetical protein [Holosporales bacterium]